MTEGVSIPVPSEPGGSRMVNLTVRERAKCRTCREEILRVSSREDGMWIHRGRAIESKTYDHVAKP